MKKILAAVLTISIAQLAGCSPDAQAVVTWEEYLAKSTRSFEGHVSYVLEGDQPVTLDELRAAYERRFGERREVVGVSTAASTVNTFNGHDDLWDPSAALDLRYCISSDFGRRKTRVAFEMAQATAEWEATARVKFHYVPTADANCVDGNPEIVFAVRPWTGGGACAFFPSGLACVPRTIVIDYPDIDSGTFYPVTTIGILRHELGHVLGLRHEHIRAPALTCEEDTNWRAVTAYDSASVMHYPWCAGATNTGDMTITALDAQGAALLYPSTVTTHDFTDASGTVTVRIKECSWSGVAAHPSASCSVDPDFVLVGGGAEIEGEYAPGALLTASYPSADLTTWTASSKDHIKSFPHRVRAYAVGLRLQNLSAATLRNYMAFVETTSTTASHPSVSATLPAGVQLLGGGARATSTGAGQLLITSRPQGTQWIASSKDHLISSPGTVTAYAIGIVSGPIFGFGTLEVLSNSASAFISSGYASAGVSAPAGWVLTSAGGHAQYAGAGRLLTDIIPYGNASTNTVAGATARSKDHEAASSGTTTAYQVYARKQ